MSITFTHHRTLSVLAVMSLLLVAGGCSESQSPDTTQSTDAITEGVMDPAPGVTTIELTEPATTPDTAPAEAPEPAAAMDEAAGSATASADGEAIYNKACKVCHAAGIAGAPKLGDSAAWASRTAKGEDALYTSVMKGLNAMPPKGACMSCSEDELKSAVQYMLSQAG